MGAKRTCDCDAEAGWRAEAHGQIACDEPVEGSGDRAPRGSDACSAGEGAEGKSKEDGLGSIRQLNICPQ